jgi:hypothetical protein
MNQIDTLYTRLLRFYPAGFRAEFADEMALTFRLGAADAAQSGLFNQLTYYLRELTGLIVSLATEHTQEGFTMQSTNPTVHKARWIARIASLLMAAFFIAVSTPNLNNPINVLILVYHVVMLGVVLAAWRWELTGGIAAIVGGTLIGLIVLAGMLSLTGMFLLSVVGALVWLLPYALMGTIFVLVARRSQALTAQTA